jgi:hypothetical protein
MAKHSESVDIADMPESSRLVNEVETSKQPLVLRRHGKDVAVLSPTPARKSGRKSRKSAGSDPLEGNPLWAIVGIGASDGPDDVSTRKHEYLADVQADLH